MDYTVHGILQARILEWVATPFSRGSSQLRDQTQVQTILYQLSHQGSHTSGKRKSTEITPVMIQMLKLAHGDFKAPIITMLKDIKICSRRMKK